MGECTYAHRIRSGDIKKRCQDVAKALGVDTTTPSYSNEPKKKTLTDLFTRSISRSTGNKGKVYHGG